jgi:ATP synthase protein I
MTGAEIARPPVYLINCVQLVVLVVASLLLMMSDKVIACSVFGGGLIAIVPQVYFAFYAFRWRGAQSAQASARASYVGQVGKFALSVAGFAAVFTVIRPVSGPAVFTGFLAMLAIQIIGSWLLLRRNWRT